MTTPLSADEQQQALRRAEDQAIELFDQCVRRGLIVAGKTERELSQDVFELAHDLFGTKRYWHKRIVRAGANTLHAYAANPPDLTIAADDIVFFDFGPVFGDWEADLGRTFVLGEDPRKHQLAADVESAWWRGAEYYLANPGLTAAGMYAHALELATAYGWTFGHYHCGHLIGRFPHEQIEGDDDTRYLRHGNPSVLRGLGAAGEPMRWILEIHFIDPERQIGAFHEQMLPPDPGTVSS